MGRYWDVFNLDKKQYAYNKLEEIGHTDFWEGLLDSIPFLARPVIPSKRIWPMTTRLLQIKLSPATCLFLKLPPELIFCVFEFLGELLDIISLCMAHGILGAVGEPYLYKCTADMYMQCSWAGDRLICVCNDLAADAFPRNVQEHVTHELERYIAADHGGNEEYTRNFQSYLREEATRGLSSKSKITDIFYTKRWFQMTARSDTEERYQVVQRAIFRIDPLQRLHASGLALCINISKGEYVRGDAIKELGSDGPARIGLKRVNVCLDHALSAYFCWSSDGNWRMPLTDDNEKKLTRGRWAGDRFEIVHEDEMRSDLDWVDITDKAVTWLTELWKEYFV